MRRGGYWSSGGYSYERDWLQPLWNKRWFAYWHAMSARVL
jgi:hypothetical protein